MPNSSKLGSSIPGKVFILGEYAVLAGAPALVAALGPRFRISSSDAAPGFDPRSPAGRLLLQVGGRGLKTQFSFEDPFEGRGGFGASSAQFALSYAAFAQDMGWEMSALGAWQAYRKLHVGQAVLPSGADLVAQWTGGVTSFRLASATQAEVADVSQGFDWSRLMIFSATSQPGRKTATHAHLPQLDMDILSDEVLAKSVSRGIDAVKQGSVRALGQSMNAFAGLLSALGLELPAATEDRYALARIPGVAGVKGAGAMLSDAVIVLIEDVAAKPNVIREATARGLDLVTDALVPEGGLSS